MDLRNKCLVLSCLVLSCLVLSCLVLSKVNFGHPKWPTAAILSKISKKNKVEYCSEMARNSIESEFLDNNLKKNQKSVLI